MGVVVAARAVMAEVTMHRCALSDEADYTPKVDVHTIPTLTRACGGVAAVDHLCTSEWRPRKMDPALDPALNCQWCGLNVGHGQATCRYMACMRFLTLLTPMQHQNQWDAAMQTLRNMRDIVLQHSHDWGRRMASTQHTLPNLFLAYTMNHGLRYFWRNCRTAGAAHPAFLLMAEILANLDSVIAADNPMTFLQQTALDDPDSYLFVIALGVAGTVSALQQPNDLGTPNEIYRRTHCHLPSAFADQILWPPPEWRYAAATMVNRGMLFMMLAYQRVESSIDERQQVLAIFDEVELNADHGDDEELAEHLRHAVRSAMLRYFHRSATRCNFCAVPHALAPGQTCDYVALCRILAAGGNTEQVRDFLAQRPALNLNEDLVGDPYGLDSENPALALYPDFGAFFDNIHDPEAVWPYFDLRCLHFARNIDLALYLLRTHGVDTFDINVMTYPARIGMLAAGELQDVRLLSQMAVTRDPNVFSVALQHADISREDVIRVIDALETRLARVRVRAQIHPLFAQQASDIRVWTSMLEMARAAASPSFSNGYLHRFFRRVHRPRFVQQVFVLLCVFARLNDPRSPRELPRLPTEIILEICASMNLGLEVGDPHEPQQDDGPDEFREGDDL